LAQFVHKKKLAKKPQAHLPYHEGLVLVKSFLAAAAGHTVEELQLFTSQWVPVPRWVKTENIVIPQDKVTEAADLLQKQLGEDGIKRVGGPNWWQWRIQQNLKGEWIEMRRDYNLRKKGGGATNRVMMFVHGGAYFFGSVDVHRYMLQRHARKLKARVFAPRYRLAPQFPFPCGLQDCLAAYLYLLTVQEANTIVLAGDSAGGGMILALLVLLRDQGIPLPAGAVLISPWCDLTHSFPSVAGDASEDYVPNYGFHHRPSASWPPVIDTTELKKDESTEEQAEEAAKSTRVGTCTVPPASGTLSVEIDGKIVEISEQIQMYATNAMVTHPMVSSILQPSLGGLPPLMVMTGGGEVLRDEQIYLAHKAANPAKYPPPELYLNATPGAKEQITKYPPTDVNLQLWDDCCHVAMTLSFTRPAKYQFRSVAQFSAWALAKAQNVPIPVQPDNESLISRTQSEVADAANSEEIPAEDRHKPNYQTAEDKLERSASLDEGAQVGPSIENEEEETPAADPSVPSQAEPEHLQQLLAAQIGSVGVPLPKFTNHMLRQRIDRHGVIHNLAPESELAALQLPRDQIGVVKEGPVKKWLEQRAKWDKKYSRDLKKTREQHYARVKELEAFNAQQKEKATNGNTGSLADHNPSDTKLETTETGNIKAIVKDNIEVPPPAALYNRWVHSKNIGAPKKLTKEQATSTGLLADGHEIGIEQRDAEKDHEKRRKKLWATSIWSLWGGRHDEKVVEG
jgi:acetyl esterase/lipase